METTAKTRVTPEEYLEKRVDQQIAWYEKKSAVNKRWFYIGQTTIIFCSALIPLFVGYSEKEGFEWLKYIGGALGATVAITGGLMALKRYRDNWRIYRATIEALQREKYLYFGRIDPYHDADDTKNFKNFMSRAEQLMSSENTTWLAKLDTKTDEKFGQQ
jgi:hypothetical protein